MFRAIPRALPAGPRAAGRRERRKLVTRQELLLAGRRLFGRKGLYESSVEDLTESAGIAKGTFYQYFRSKEDLIQAVVADAFRELGSRVDEHVLGERSLERAAAAVAEAHVEFFAQNLDLMRILHQMRGVLKFHRPGAAALRRVLNAHLWRIASHLGRARDAARLPARRRLALAAILFGAVSGAISVRVTSDPARRLGNRQPDLADAFAGLARAYVGRRPA